MIVDTPILEDVNADLMDNLEFTNIGLSAEGRLGMVERLNQLLADEHLLYVKTRNFHWNLRGPLFASLHELFEQQYNDLQLIADEVAERARMLGGFAAGSVQEFLELTRLSEMPGSHPPAQTMVSRLLDDQEAIINYIRSDVDDSTEQFGDEGTADLLIGIMRQHEKMAWMLRSLLAEDIW